MTPGQCGCRLPVLLLCFLAPFSAAALGENSLSISPDSDELFYLPRLGASEYAPGWLNVSCKPSSGFTPPDSSVTWTRNGRALDITVGHIVSEFELYFRVHHLHTNRQVIQCAAQDSDNVTHTASVGFLSLAGHPTPTVEVVRRLAHSVTLRATSTLLQGGESLVASYDGTDKSVQASQVADILLPDLNPSTPYTVLLTYRKVIGAQEVVGLPRVQTFTTRAVPAQPSGVRATLIVHNSFRLQWSALQAGQWNSDASDSMRRYRVVVERRSTPGVVKVNVTTAASFLDVPDLMPAQSYSVYLSAESRYGSNEATLHQVTTLPAPQLAQVTFSERVSTNQVAVTLAVSFAGTWNAPYVIEYMWSENGNSSFTTKTGIVHEFSTGGAQVVYVKAVPVINEMRLPQYSADRLFTTSATAPASVTGLRSTLGFTIAVSWTGLAEEDWNGLAPRSYRVCWMVQGTSATDRCLTIADHLTTLALPDLEPSMTYSVRVAAMNSFGAGAESTVSVTTRDPLITKINRQRTDSTRNGRGLDHIIYDISVDRSPDWYANYSVSYSYTVDGGPVEQKPYAMTFSLRVGGHKNVNISAHPVINGSPMPTYGVSHFSFTTDFAVPTNPVIRLVPGSDFIAMSWDEIQSNGLRSDLVIKLGMPALPGKPEDQTIQLSVQQAAQMSYTINGLKPVTTYSVFLEINNQDAKNTDESSKKTTETLPAAPLSVKGLDVSSVNASHVGVSWLPMDENRWRNKRSGHRVIRACIQPGVLGDSVLCRDLNATAVSHVFGPLMAFTGYEVTIVTENSIGREQISTRVRTSADAPSKVRNLAWAQDSGSFSTVKLMWNEPEDKRGTILHYRVRVSEDRVRVSEAIPTGDDVVLVQNMNTTATRLDLQQLNGFTRYTVVVDAFTVTYGDMAVVSFRTNVGAPSSAPTIIQIASRLAGGSLLLNVSNPVPANGRIVSYTVVYHTINPGRHGPIERREFNATSSEACVDALSCNAKNANLVLDALDYVQEYKVYVIAFTTAGNSSRSNRHRGSTLGGEPDPPRNVTVSFATSDSLLLEWLPPTAVRARTLVYNLRLGSAEWTVESDISHTGFLNFTIEDLDAYTIHTITITAYNNRKSSSLVEVTGMTLEGAPSAPRNFRKTCKVSARSIFQWDPPKSLNGPAVVYETNLKALESISSGDDYASRSTVTLIDPSWSPEFPLQPYTNYSLTVTAIQNMSRLASTALTSFVYCEDSSFVPKAPARPSFGGGGEPNITNGRVQITLSPPPQDFVDWLYVVVEQTSLTARRRRATVDTKTVAALHRNALPSAFVVGDGQKYGPYTNSPLAPDYKYRIGTVAGTTPVNSGDRAPGQWSPTEGVVYRKETAPTPVTPSNTTTIIIAGAVGGAVILMLVAILVILVVRYYSRKKPEPEPAPATPREDFVKTKPFDVPIQTHFLSPNGDPIEELRASGNKVLEAHPPVPLARFAQQVAELKEEGCIAFSEEYSALPLQFDGYTTNNSDMTINRMKNRYSNIKAFDHSRVLLNAVRGNPGSDYVNANYIDGHNEKNAYIATQGPVEETLADFWRMVWEQGSATIVMLTNLEENGKPKCSQYWPDSGTVAYGGIEVTISETVPLADYVVRVFNLVKVGRDEPMREVRQFQFTAWPDQSAPRHATPMLLFRRKVRQLTPEGSGPMIVHCSAGIGRTGTFIAIDSMLNRAETMDTLDVFGYCTVMRTQRNYMVQVEEQYVFIHDAIKESLECGNTEILAKDLPQALQRLHQPSLTDDTVTSIEAEFRRLSLQRIERLCFLAALRDCNVSKNRFAKEMFLPFDEYRVRLPLSTKTEAGGDYINASFIDGYKSHGAFIAAESPLAQTEDSFWEMIWHTGSKVVLMLTDTEERGEEVCHPYWPVDTAAQYGNCLVDPISEQTKTDASQQVVYTLRQFKMTNKMGDSTRTVCLFQYTGPHCWPEGQGYPVDSSTLATGRRSLIDLIGEVQKLQERTDDHSPVVIHCNTGVGRTGCFIALSTIIERMRCEGLLDVFMTVKSLRTHRPYLVQTLAEYCFVYDTVLEYLSPFDHFTDAMETDVGDMSADGSGGAVPPPRYSVDVTV